MRLMDKLFYCFALIIFCWGSTSLAAEQLIVEPEMGRAPILSFMHEAKSSIKLVIYGLTDEQFIHALIQEKDKGKNVQVLLEPKPYRAENENVLAIQQLRADKLDLQQPNPDFKLLHQKTLLIDQNYAIVMTFNFTHSTFKKQRNFALVITDPAEIKEIQSVFSADCQHKNITVHHPNLAWSPNNSREKILNLIHNAHSSIKIYAEGLSDYQVIGALAKAASSGVNVQVLMSAEWNKRENKKFAYLSRAKAYIRFSKNYMIHAKVILIDQNRALLGSINLTKPSMDDNRELSVITDAANVVNELNRTFDQDWREANFPKRYTKKAVAHMLKQLLRAAYS